MTNHPITPPPELVEQWLENTRSQDCIGAYPANYEQLICTQAARWGADQELDACKEWVSWRHSRHESDELLFSRRPKPPSLKEHALKILEEEPESDDMKELIVFDTAQVDIIRRALEQLND